MTTTPREFWESKHRKYSRQDWIREHNFLADEAGSELPPSSKILDLGSGQGADAVFFASLGHTVVAADFSPFALDQFRKEAESAGVEQVLLDIGAVPYPFMEGAFDAVYAHLSVHYFSAYVTTEVFEEVARLVRGEGFVFMALNSIRDPECGTGAELEPGYFELAPGDCKRFFSTEATEALLDEHFSLSKLAYARGTKKNSEDEVVLVTARRKVDR